MNFDDWWEARQYSADTYSSYGAAKTAWDAARPLPLTEEEIRECWRECQHSAPMAFARELQKKLGIIG